jgi:hypothetical protein
MMAIWSSSPEALKEALIDLGFSAAHEFSVFVTYERQRDSVKVHVAPDGMFAAFGEDDEILGEGTGAEDLRSVVMEAALTSERDTPQRRSFLDRHTKRMTRSGTGNRARSRSDHGEGANATLSTSAFSDRNR